MDYKNIDKNNTTSSDEYNSFTEGKKNDFLSNGFVISDEKSWRNKRVNSMTVVIVITATLLLVSISALVISSMTSSSSGQKDQKSIILTPAEDKNVIIPNTVGLPIDTAVNTIKDLGLTVETIDEDSKTIEKNKVIRTEPSAGGKIALTSTVKVYVSKGDTSKKKVEVPDVASMSTEQAIEMLKKSNLIGQAVRNPSDPNFVTGSNPSAHSTVEEGSTIKLYFLPTNQY
jgi:hypothetical protein